MFNLHISVVPNIGTVASSAAADLFQQILYTLIWLQNFCISVVIEDDEIVVIAIWCVPALIVRQTRAVGAGHVTHGTDLVNVISCPYLITFRATGIASTINAHGPEDQKCDRYYKAKKPHYC